MHSTDPSFPLFPILSFLAFIVSFIPFPWHVRAGNIGTCAYMISTGIYSLVEFINSLIWAGSVANVAPAWCDISAQIIIGATIGISASTLAVSRQLYRITTTPGQSRTLEEKRRDNIIDLTIVFGLPILVMILHVIVQPNRFDILENIGCEPATFNTLAAYFLYFMWPVLIGVCTFVYSILTFRAFYMRRLAFGQFKSANSSMSPSRYLRLLLLVFVDMICNTPLGIFAIVAGTRSTLEPFSSWSDTHDFRLVRLVPASEWQKDRVQHVLIEINRWLPVFCSFVFFAFFGFAQEAKKNYALFFLWIGEKTGIRVFQKAARGNAFVGSKGLPMHQFNARAPYPRSAGASAMPTDSYLGTVSDVESPCSPETPYSCASSSRPLIPEAPSTRQSSFQLDHASFHVVDLNEEAVTAPSPPSSSLFTSSDYYRAHIQSLR